MDSNSKLQRKFKYMKPTISVKRIMTILIIVIFVIMMIAGVIIEINSLGGFENEQINKLSQKVGDLNLEKNGPRRRSYGLVGVIFVPLLLFAIPGWVLRKSKTFSDDQSFEKISKFLKIDLICTGIIFAIVTELTFTFEIISIEIAKFLFFAMFFIGIGIPFTCAFARFFSKPPKF